MGMDNIPQELRCLRQWVCYRPERDPENPDRLKKPPYRTDGAYAKPNDPDTWTTFDEARKAVEEGGHGFTGVGFVLTAGDPYAVVDMDHVRDPETGEVCERAAAAVEALDSYAEVSCSGTGIHVFVRAENPEGGHRKDNAFGPGTEYEVYDGGTGGRYIAMTGDILDGRAEVQDRQEAFTAVYREFFPEATTEGGNPTERGAPSLWTSTASEVLEVMRRSRKWPEIEPLMRGDTAAHGGDDSCADLALCNHLAFFTGKSPDLMDELFRGSGLMRGKWDEMHGAQTYGQKTIAKAVQDCRAVYDRGYSSGQPGAVSPSQWQTTGLPQAMDLTEHWGSWGDMRKPVLVEGLLRKGHKAVYSSASKAGKSWAALNLAVAVCTGSSWMGFHCEQGPVLYVNFEIDPASFAHRCETVAREAWQRTCGDKGQEEYERAVASNLRVLNYRGQSCESKDFAEAIIREADRIPNLALVVIDPLYMFSDADENSAKETKDVMAQLDRICEDSGAALMFVHHYTKGKPGQKSAMDRFSGSGVFARSPDAVIDVAPLHVDQDNAELVGELDGAVPLRLEASLREFAPMAPVNVLYSHPLYLRTDSKAVACLDVEGENQAREKRDKAKRGRMAEADSEEARYLKAFRACADSGDSHEAGGITYVRWTSLYRKVKEIDADLVKGVSEKTAKAHAEACTCFGTCYSKDVGISGQGPRGVLLFSLLTSTEGEPLQGGAA